MTGRLDRTPGTGEAGTGPRPGQGGVRYLLISAATGVRRRRPEIAVYPSADEARARFSDLRPRLAPAGGWAELAAVDPHGRLTPLCAFGDAPSAAATAAAGR
jgi:hypothetical protein